jgi:hypothetical protein
MPPLDERPFRFEEESDREPAEIRILMGHPRVRPRVVPVSSKPGEPTQQDFVTTFLVAWQPSPTPPARWIELLRKAPFGTQAIRASDLRWDGHSFSIELMNESDVEAFGVEMPDWVAFANAEFGRREQGHTPADQALADAHRRAEALESRLRRTDH